jgi:hypothetical protein
MFRPVLLLLSMLFFFNYTEAQSFTSKGHIMYGNLAHASSQFRKVYEVGGNVGANLMVGINNIYIITKYQNYSALGTPKTWNLPETGFANWNQNLFSAGLRYYESTEDRMGIFTELSFTRCVYSEEIGVDSPGYEYFHEKYSNRQDGFGLAFGVFERIKFISIEATAEYLRILINPSSGIIQRNMNIGGVMFTISAGFHISEKDEK